MGGKAFAVDREVGLKRRQCRNEYAAREMIEADDSGSWSDCNDVAVAPLGRTGAARIRL